MYLRKSVQCSRAELKRRRRIPFDFQRTSLAGLALESAPVVASEEPPLCNAGPHPGTTWNYKTGGIIHQLIEQPGHAEKKMKLEQISVSNVGLLSGREKKKREIVMARKRAENREGSLGFPGFVKPVFTKDSKPLGRRQRSLGYLGSVKPALT
ncbi:hypothetical protein TNCV_9531 [Trichonephila clavipes]|nr:hypothetical protein TNCV_9531 [Trichonephila clavipes]